MVIPGYQKVFGCHIVIQFCFICAFLYKYNILQHFHIRRIQGTIIAKIDEI